MKLFCFPYAGGNASIYKRWKYLIGPQIIVRPIELAGRGKRTCENPYGSFEELVDDVLCIIEKEIAEEEYVFFGHSMGAKIAFELAQKISENGLPVPGHIFFSGRGAPGILDTNPVEYHKLSDTDFIEAVVKIGGTEKEFCEHQELVDFFLPILRNDFKLAETESERKEIKPLLCDITVFVGKDEDLTPGQIDGWKHCTSGLCSIHYFKGGHFFINEFTEEIVEKIKNVINFSL